VKSKLKITGLTEQIRWRKVNSNSGWFAYVGIEGLVPALVTGVYAYVYTLELIPPEGEVVRNRLSQDPEGFEPSTSVRIGGMGLPPRDISTRIVNKLPRSTVIQIASSVCKAGSRDIRDVLKIAKLCNPRDTEEALTRLLIIHQKYRKTLTRLLSWIVWFYILPHIHTLSHCGGISQFDPGLIRPSSSLVSDIKCTFPSDLCFCILMYPKLNI
jgi:hypothetical protein